MKTPSHQQINTLHITYTSMQQPTDQISYNYIYENTMSPTNQQNEAKSMRGEKMKEGDICK
jgi:hypothetical protein